MLLRIARNLLLLPFAVFLNGCEKNATIPVPESKSKLVVVCFLSPEAEWTEVTVSRSKPLFGGPPAQQATVKNAIVTLEGAGSVFSLPFDEELQKYRLPATGLDLKSGIPYVLRVSEPGGAQVWAETRIPEKKDWAYSATAYDSVVSTFQPTAYFFRINFRDPGPEKSWYRINAFTRTLDYFDPDTTTVIWAPIDFSLDNRFYESGPVPGQSYDIRISEGGGPSGVPDSLREFSFHLLSVNEAYYEYHKRLLTFEPDNPFAEPQTLYTNIQGGLGIFAAYREERRRIVRP